MQFMKSIQGDKFQHDNAHPHSAVITQSSPQSVDMFFWTTRLPNLSPIEQTARGGRVRSTTPAEDRYIVLSAKKEQTHHSSAGGKSVFAASGKQISRKTVARRLRIGGLYARRPVVCVPMTRR
ncbi:hypothetical protein TNCV_1188101 [Trichonephila clavipes]|nr:hypothetical protein TNCV_1188101 [Trichonephila clavipes]